MKKPPIVIDTNALISFVTDRNQSQQKKITQLFENAARLQALILCPQNVLTEFVYVLDSVYHVPKATIKRMILDFISMPGIEIVHDIDLKRLFSYWPDRITDYGDAVVASLCSARRGAMVATFDRKFGAALKKIGIPVYREPETPRQKRR